MVSSPTAIFAATATMIATTATKQETDASIKETVIIGWQIKIAREEIIAIFCTFPTRKDHK
jgi:hypothetical protein